MAEYLHEKETVSNLVHRPTTKISASQTEKQDMIANNQYDVAILGGGLAGLTLAKQLLMKRPETSIAVIEKRSFPVSETTHKVGESTVEIGAHYFGEELQLKKHLTDQQLPKFGLRFFFKDACQSLAEGTEVGGSTFFSAPSYQVDRGRLENYLGRNRYAKWEPRSCPGRESARSILAIRPQTVTNRPITKSRSCRTAANRRFVLAGSWTPVVEPVF